MQAIMNMACVYYIGQGRRSTAQSYKEFINMAHKQGIGFFCNKFCLYRSLYISLYTSSEPSLTLEA